MAIRELHVSKIMELAKHLASKVVRHKEKAKAKVCSCGATYYFIPKSAKRWDYDESRVMWIWGCKCGTHLVWPFDEKASRSMNLPLMPTEEEFGLAVERASDSYKEFREKELIAREHDEWWERNKPEDE